MVTQLNNGRDIRITLEDGGSVTLLEETEAWEAGVELVRFADGTTWTRPDLLGAAFGPGNRVLGSAGSDLLTGTDGQDVLVGYGGNDVMSGGADNDTYVVAAGEDSDVINEAVGGGFDTLNLRALRARDVSVARDGNDALLSLAGGGSVRLTEEFIGGGVEQILLADTTWTNDDLKGRYLAGAGTIGDDSIRGFDGRDDTLVGGRGSDRLEGGTGSDTYIYGAGDGIDTVVEAADPSATDRLVLGSGIRPEDVSVSVITGDPTSVQLNLGAGGVYLPNQLLNNGSGIEQIVFADGTLWDPSKDCRPQRRCSG